MKTIFLFVGVTVSVLWHAVGFFTLPSEEGAKPHFMEWPIFWILPIFCLIYCARKTKSKIWKVLIVAMALTIALNACLLIHAFYIKPRADTSVAP